MERILAKNLSEYVGKQITICGWINSKRSHGKIAFIDIRDRSGISQAVLLPGNKQYDKIVNLPIESVISIKGEVCHRPQGMINKDIESGDVEIKIDQVEIFSEAENLPFEIALSETVNEDIRLKYRYLDLRNQKVKSKILNRSKIIKYIIDYLSENDFIYIQTPLLSKSTPEGARDFLVPSRLHKGKFFALPQSPQQYKQLLMVAGIERYFQIAPCFRDEDARADRSPGEFYQLDLEMSFVEQDDILDLTEKMFIKMIIDIFPNKKITLIPFPRFTYDEVMKRYGSDKPDLRKDKNDPDELSFVWILDFPLFNKQNEKDYFHGSGKSEWAPSHHMFTAPKKEDIPMLDTNPGKVKSYQHDLVLNGIEVGGGSIRIHNHRIQEKIWDLIGFSKDQKKQFGHLIEAFKYGVPPHGGIAPGLDRLIAILLGENNIREVIAFPLNGEGRDPLMDSPCKVTDEQLKELKIKIS